MRASGARAEAPLSILLISPGFPDRDDRYTPGITETLFALVERGHHIDIHTIRKPPRSRHVVFGGLPVSAHGDGGFVRRHTELLGAVRARHRRVPYDLVWSIWPNLTGPAAVAAKTILGRPLVASLAGGELEIRPELRYGNPRPYRLSAVLLAADRVTAGGEPIAARARATGRRIDVAPLGVDFGQIPIRHRPPDGPLRIAIIGDRSAIKRTSLAVDAARQLATTRETTITTFGDFDTPHPSVEPKGFVPPRELRRALRSFDLMIHASAHESQGIAMIEAAYAGLALATFDVGVARELQRLGCRLRVADRVSALGLAEAATTALATESIRPADRLRIESRFSAAACAARFERLFGGLVSRRNSHVRRF